MDVTGAAITALGVALKANFQKGFSDVETSLQKIATEVPSTTASNEYDWLNDWPELREWIGARRIKELSGNGYTITNKLFEATIGVKRTYIEDDNLGIFSARAEAQGKAAAKWPDKTLFSIVKKGFDTACYDGQNFFDADHKTVDEDGNIISYSNLQAGTGIAWYLLDTSQSLMPFIWQPRIKPEFTAKTDDKTSDHVFTNDEYLFGTRARGNAGFGFYELAYASKAPLNETNFDLAYDAMATQVNDEGSPLGVMPTLLMVPQSMRKQADEVIKRSRKANGEENTNQNLVEVLVCPWL